ncbi:RagB/SusD family nutrient uptake outer membrane protein [Chitinophaga filiformis]|uniref:RagB/SusD family nutrient uptake outer membrane protein n=1 Tax=Chitinophaga filiformis TaxID=104663 RepID=A0ABY4I8U4_CHIFI|nr:RagB/SusD family nutrient uptake outer membrane protein [Chitinophaga filiformis]UPK72088.1 RagB/SusD family nutrient uptake outer membrane protein [Chitinophaga filiformis]
MKRNIKSCFILLTGLLLSGSCTNIDEKLYDRITSDNFLQTKADVIRDFLRPFEHSYWSIQGGATFMLQENSTDELMTLNRQGDWYDGAQYQRVHYHTWTPNDNYTSDAWNALYQGINLATNSLEDLQGIQNPGKFNLTQAELDDYIAELKTLRAWLNIRVLDLYRNMVIVTKVKGETQSGPQVTPQEAFDFIEKELKEAIPALPTRQDLGANAIGRWTKGGAAALLVRLYLNAKVYTGKERFTDCATVCQDIIDGKYGTYALENRWDAPFDYNNSQSAETIFGFPGSFGLTHWQYSSNMYFWMMPYQATRYLGFTDFGEANPKYALQPGRDVDSVEYTFTMGKPFVKFQRYPDDYRLKKYKNLGNSKREGMFLYGYLPYVNADGKTDTVRGNKGPYALFLRDQVGMFLNTPPGVKISDKESNMNHGDHNSGVFPIKYPYYPNDDDNKISSAYAEIRLAEIYYSLAECKYRAEDRPGAAALLNAVRTRNYPAGSPSLYNANGSQLTDQEMLDEWGREFLVEGRRRTDLVRWGVFHTGTWWDKQPDADDHTTIFPIGQNVLNAARILKQNPGY